MIDGLTFMGEEAVIITCVGAAPGNHILVFFA